MVSLLGQSNIGFQLTFSLRHDYKTSKCAEVRWAGGGLGLDQEKFPRSTVNVSCPRIPAPSTRNPDIRSCTHKLNIRSSHYWISKLM